MCAGGSVMLLQGRFGMEAWLPVHVLSPRQLVEIVPYAILGRPGCPWVLPPCLVGWAQLLTCYTKAT